MRDRAMVVMVFGCGLRHGELLSLRLSDVDLAEQVVIVRPDATKGRRGHRRGREVRLPPEVLRELDTYLDDWRSGPDDPDAALWLDRAGAPSRRAGLATSSGSSKSGRASMPSAPTSAAIPGRPGIAGSVPATSSI